MQYENKKENRYYIKVIMNYVRYYEFCLQRRKVDANRSAHQRCSTKKGVLKNFGEFT